MPLAKYSSRVISHLSMWTFVHIVCENQPLVNIIPPAREELCHGGHNLPCVFKGEVVGGVGKERFELHLELAGRVDVACAVGPDELVFCALDQRQRAGDGRCSASGSRLELARDRRARQILDGAVLALPPYPLPGVPGPENCFI